VPRRVGVGRALASGAHAALARIALRADAARAEAVREQHHEAAGREPLAPVAVAGGNRGAALAEALAIMQRDDRRKRTVAGGSIQIPLQPEAILAELDRLGRGGGRDAKRHKQERRQVPHGTPDGMCNERV